MRVDKYGLVIQATPAVGCPACESKDKRRHTVEDWKYHPEAGKGFRNETHKGVKNH